MYYIVSLKHTGKNDEFLTLWRPDNAGYTQHKETAGVYENPEKGYHDSESNVPVHVDKADKYFIEDTDHPGTYSIPNTLAIYKALRFAHLID